VKKAVSILFLSAYLLANTQLIELLKFPVLIEHYQTHHKESGISFWTFLEIHYIYMHGRDADYDTDMKLPFKTISSAAASSVALCPPVLFSITEVVTNFNDKGVHPLYKFFYSSPRLDSIWQPPKTC